MDNPSAVAERDQSGVLDRLPFNLTQLLAFAMQKPRNPIKAMDSAIMQLRAMPQFASKAYYSIPFRNKDGSEVIVEGPSIKAATALTGCWGNNVEGAFIGEETNDYVDVSGYFFDYETGKLTIRPMRVSKTFKTKEGKVLPWRKDMLDRQIAAGVSKAVRNADLNGLPAGYVAEYYAEAKRIAARGGKIEAPESNPEQEAKDISAQMEKIIAAFDELGVVQKEIAEYVNRHRELDSEEKVVAHLIGILNALEDNQTTIDDVFTVSEAPISPPEAATAPKTAPGERKPVKDRVISPSWKLMRSVIAGGSCLDCGGKIAKGEEIYYDPALRKAHHRICPK